MDTTAADCGRRFNHDQHLYRSERGKTKACDGRTDKRDMPAAFVKGGGRK